MALIKDFFIIIKNLMLIKEKKDLSKMERFESKCCLFYTLKGDIDGRYHLAIFICFIVSQLQTFMVKLINEINITIFNCELFDVVEPNHIIFWIFWIITTDFFPCFCGRIIFFCLFVSES